MYRQAFIFALVFSVLNCLETAEESLILIHAVIRHGQRTPDPITAFVKDIHKNNSYYPYGNGELNQIGRVEAYKIGKNYRKRYNTFLGDVYHPSIVSAVASGSSRCRMTMQSLLAGIFPPNSNEVIKKGLAWQPIPINYQDCKQDTMLCFHTCLPLVLNCPLNKNVSQCENRDQMNEYLTKYTGNNVNSLSALGLIQDTLKSEVENNLKLEEWAEAIYPEPITTCAHDIWRSFTSNKTILAMTAGPLLRKIINDTNMKIDDIAEKSPQKKLFIYTAHDYNLYVLLGILGLYKNC